MFCFCFFFVLWIFFLLYTGAFQEERFIWTRKVRFFLLAMCYINTYSFSFFFLVRLYLWKKDLVGACVWFRLLFLLLLGYLFFFRTLHRCISRRKVHLNKKGAFFFYFPCVRLTRIRFFCFLFLLLYLRKKYFVGSCVGFHVLFLLLLGSFVIFFWRCMC